MVDTEMERVPFWRCRNLSLIVPLCGLGESLLKTGFIHSVRDLGSNAASNEAYYDCAGIC